MFTGAYFPVKHVKESNLSEREKTVLWWQRVARANALESHCSRGQGDISGPKSLSVTIRGRDF